MRALPLVLVSLAACGGGSTALWRGGVSRSGLERQAAVARTASDVTVHLKRELGAFEGTEARKVYMCGTTVVLRKAFLLDPPLGDPPPARARVLGRVTTEEFPRDEAASRIHGPQVFTLLGMGTDACDLFDVRLDPGFREDALLRLRELAAALGADAVVDVFATGEAEHHMWHGSSVSLDPTSTRSPVYARMDLLDFKLRDVRLHGTAVRRAD